MRRVLPAALIALCACATIEDVAFDKYEAFLSGGSIATGQDGHLYGSGTAQMWLGQPPLELCYRLFVQKIGAPYAAHLHRGPATSIGPEILALRAPDDGDSRGCANITPRLKAEIKAHPEEFYIDVHTAEFPLGALRGQLVRQSPDVTPDS